ncbi:hypothetical protein ABTW96_27900 [Nocardia beijingensis]
MSIEVGHLRVADGLGHRSDDPLIRNAMVANYATGGAVVIHYPVQNGTC